MLEQSYLDWKKQQLGLLRNIQLVASSSLIPMKWATSGTLIVEYAEVNSWNILFL